MKPICIVRAAHISNSRRCDLGMLLGLTVSGSAAHLSLQRSEAREAKLTEGGGGGGGNTTLTNAIAILLGNAYQSDTHASYTVLSFFFPQPEALHAPQ